MTRFLTKVQKKKSDKKHIFCSLCYTIRDSRCCQQVEKTNIFKSYKTGKTYKIFHQLTRESQAMIYLFQRRICFMPYVGKTNIKRKARKKMQSQPAHICKSDNSTRTIYFNEMRNSFLSNK